jgi:hypothetical protein
MSGFRFRRVMVYVLRPDGPDFFEEKGLVVDRVSGV